jgi:hypothetical protein
VQPAVQGTRAPPHCDCPEDLSCGGKRKPVILVVRISPTRANDIPECRSGESDAEMAPGAPLASVVAVPRPRCRGTGCSCLGSEGDSDFLHCRRRAQVPARAHGTIRRISRTRRPGPAAGDDPGAARGGWMERSRHLLVGGASLRACRQFLFEAKDAREGRCRGLQERCGSAARASPAPLSASASAKFARPRPRVCWPAAAGDEE